jgi:ABC-2 type transport system permease protein
VKKYVELLKISFLNIFEYRGEIVSDMIMSLLGIGATYFLWYKLIKDYTIIGDYNLSSIMAYFLLTGLFSGFFNLRIAKHLDKWVRDGSLASILMKPIKAFFYLFIKELGRMIGILIFVIVVFSTPFFFVPSLRSTIHLTLSNTLWIFVFSILSNIFNFVLAWTVGSLSFWIVSTGGIRNVLMNFIRIVRGSWFPLDLAPKAFGIFLSFLPFQYALYYPIKIILKGSVMSENLRGVYVLLFSITILGILSMVLWKKGLKKFNSVGM